MSHAGSDAVFDFLRVCSHGFRFKFGVRVPASAQDAPPNRSHALYVRIQAASPPPSRVDNLPWEFGIRVNDGTEAGQPLQVAAGDDRWKRDGVFQVKGIPSLDQPAPDDIVLDRWLTVPGHPTTLEFNGNVDHLGVLSASYPQPELDDRGVAQVPVGYYRQDDIPWLRDLPINNWVAISFDRFWPPERESVEYIAQIGNCDPPTTELAARPVLVKRSSGSSTMRRLSPRSTEGQPAARCSWSTTPRRMSARAVAGATETSPVGEEHGWRLGQRCDLVIDRPNAV